MTSTYYGRQDVTGNKAIKAPVRCATTANITLSGLQTIDGLTLVAGDRVLVKNQTNTVQNGIYSADTGDWTRATDLDGRYDIDQGTMVYVRAGTANQTKLFVQTTADPVIDSTALTFEVFATKA